MDKKEFDPSILSRASKICIADAINEFNRNYGYVILAYPKIITVDGIRYLWDMIDVD